MADKRCVTVEREITDPEDLALVQAHYESLIADGIPPQDAQRQAAELAAEDLLVERKEIVDEIRKAGVEVENPTIEELLTPRSAKRSRETINPLTMIFSVIASHPDAFQSRTSDKQDLPGIVDDMLGWIRHEDGARVFIAKENPLAIFRVVRDQFGEYESSQLGVLNKTSNTPYVRIHTDRGTRGSGIYQAAMAWAHNNGKTLRPDPAGLSAVNRLRRTEAMISSALRFRTVKHIIPDKSQFVGFLSQEDYDRLADEKKFDGAETMPDDIELKLVKIKNAVWDSGNYQKSLHNLIVASAKLARKRLDWLKSRGIDEHEYEATGNYGIGHTTLRRLHIAESALPEIKHEGMAESVWLGSEVPPAARVDMGVLRGRLEGLGVDSFLLGREKGSKYQGVFYKRGKKGGRDASEVERWLAVAIAKLRDDLKLKVKVLNAPSDLGDWVFEDAMGIYVDGTIYLFAGNIASVKEAKRALAHELVGHMGMERLLGREKFMRLVDQIKRMKREGNPLVEEALAYIRKHYVDENGDYSLDELQEAREIIAHIAEKNPSASILRRIWISIRKFLAKFGLANKDSALVEELVVAAARGVRSSEQKGGWSELVGGYDGINVESAGPSVAEDTGVYQQDLFDDLPNEKVIDIVKADFNVRYESVPDGDLKIGIDKITSPEDAAHVFAPMRKDAQESMMILVVDNDSRPIRVIRHAFGARDGVSVDPGVVSASIINTPGAAGFYLAHNHPGGNPKPSTADERITDRIEAVMRRTSIKSLGHIIVGDSGLSAFIKPDAGGDKHSIIKATPAPRRKKVDITVRKMRLNRRSQSPIITDYDSAKAQVMKSPDGPGVMLLNQRNRLIGFYPMSLEGMGGLERSGEFENLMRIYDSTNASAAIIYIESMSDVEKARNLGTMFANVYGPRPLDIIDKTDGWSAAESGYGTENPNGIWYKRRAKSISDLPTGPVTRPTAIVAARKTDGNKAAAEAYARSAKQISKNGLMMASMARHTLEQDGKGGYRAELFSGPKMPPGNTLVENEGMVYIETADDMIGPFDTAADAAIHVSGRRNVGDRMTPVRISIMLSGSIGDVKISANPSNMGATERFSLAGAVVEAARQDGAQAISGGILAVPEVSSYIKAAGGSIRTAADGRMVADIGAIKTDAPAYSRRTRINKKTAEIKKAAEKKTEVGDSFAYQQKVIRSKRFQQLVDAVPGLRAKLNEHKGTAWAGTVSRALVIRDEINQVASGKKRWQDSPVISATLGKALEKGGVFAYLEKVGTIGQASKPGANVNASFIECNPSKLCAAACYSANGRSGKFSNAIVKQEILQLAAEQDPERLARMIVRDYKKAAGVHWQNEALRMLEAGDLSPAFVKVIDAMNKGGVRAHVFSKHPDLLQQLDQRNAVLLSIDASNASIADGNNLPLSIMYSGADDVAMLERFRDRFDPDGGRGVILPIETRNGFLPAKDIEAIPREAKEFVCPVNIGKWGGENAIGACSKCQIGIGCHKNRPTESYNLKSIRKVHDTLNAIEQQLKKPGISNEQIDKIEARLEELIGQINAARDAGRTAVDESASSGASVSGEGKESQDAGKDSDLGTPAYARRRTESVTMVIGKDGDGNTITVETTHPSREARSRLRSLWQVWLTKEGGLDKLSHLRRVEMDGMKNADELNVKFFVAELKAEVRQYYRKSYGRLDETDIQAMDSYLKGNLAANVDDGVKPALEAMRTAIDGFSAKMQIALMDNIKYRLEDLNPKVLENTYRYMAAKKVGLDADKYIDNADPYVVAKLDLIETMASNMGSYITRSYRIFDDPKWADEVRKNDEIMDNARTYFEGELSRKGITGKELDDAVDGHINQILFKASRSSDMLSFMYSDLLGQKDTSILKRRKGVPKEIRALLGEYKDPVLNFARSVSKMSYFVANHYFLKKIREDGMGVFLTKQPRGRFSVKIDDFDKESLRPLQGLYTSPEIYDALRDAIERPNFEPWVRTALAINSFAKMGKTVLSPVTAFRNFYSASMFSVANGHFNLLYSIRAAQHTFADLFTQNRSSIQYLDRMVRLGVLHDNPYSSELNEAIKDFTTTDTYGDKGLRKVIKALFLVAQHFYQSGDDFWKIIGFENEKKMLMRAGFAEKEAEREAATRIRDTYPTYSMVPKIIRWLRRMPLIGVFTSFPWEIGRTVPNIIQYAAKDMKEGRIEMATRRGIGIAIAGGVSYGISIALMSLLGLDDEDDENIRQLAPEWQRFAQLAYTGIDEDGRLRWIDLSHLDPYTYLKEPVGVLLDGSVPTYTEKASIAAMKLLEPFISNEIGYQAMSEVWNNINLETGRPIVPEGTPPERAAAMFINHLRKNLQPGIADSAERIYKALNDIVEPSGRKYTKKDEIAALVGVRFTTLDVETALVYRAGDTARKLREVSTVMTHLVRSLRKMDEDDVIKETRRFLSQRARVYDSLIRATKAARALGYTDATIYESMINAGIGKDAAKQILNGKTPRYKLNRDLIKSTMRRAGKSGKPELADEIMHRAEIIMREIENEADTGMGD